MTFDEVRLSGAHLFENWHECHTEVYVDLTDSDARPLTALLMGNGFRLAAVFAEDRTATEARCNIYYVFEHPGDPRYLLARAPVTTAFHSLAAEIPAVNWQEREIQDWFGLTAEGHPNPRRVALHDNWPEVHPLRKDFPLDTVLPPFEGERHVYRPTLGEGVFQIPVGPVHAGIIEPGHFNFAVAGEPILYLQLRMFYTHKGTEKRFEQLPLHRAVFLAESISGDSGFSHGTAFCQAVEGAANVELPERARRMRTILLELERLYNHVGDIGAIVTDVGFAIANAHASRLREMILSINEELTGSRLLRGVVCPGGVRQDWTPGQLANALVSLQVFEREFTSLMQLIESSDSARDRLTRTGVLRPGKAKDLGIVGVAGRASGVDRDVRRDHPYAAYDLVSLDVPVYQEGDVLRRMQVRVDEIRQSLVLIRAIESQLAPGHHRIAVPPLPEDRCALGAVEGWRGEILHWIRTGPNNTLERCKIKDPSLNNWPALVEAVQGNIVPDFPVINKSFNLSYSGDGPLAMFKILKKTAQTGLVTIGYPDQPAEMPAHYRGAPRFDFTAWTDPPAAAEACPTGAISVTAAGDMGRVTVDYGLCIYCGQCAEADNSIRMTREFALAARNRSDLVITADYGPNADSSQFELKNLDRGALEHEVQSRIHAVLGRSLAIREVDAGSCNGCEVEITALNNPVYDLERLGIHFVASPRHADMLLVTGPVTRNMELALLKTWRATPDPKVVVAVGACGISGGIFGRNYATLGGVDQVVPVDVYIPGCPPRPHALLHGILLAVGRIEQKGLPQ